MKKALLIFIIWLFASSAVAAPFLITTPVTKDGSEPTSFVVLLNSTTYTVAPTDTGTNQVYLHFDLAGKTAATNSATVKGKNMWGDSAISDPFVFSAGVPAKPSGLGLSAN